jgi:hypothetical protein
MPDSCPVCQTPIEPGATTCATCAPPAVAVAPTEPVTLAPAAEAVPTPASEPVAPTNHTLGVLAAFALPVIATVVIVSLIGIIGYGVFNLLHRLVPKPSPAGQPTAMAPPPRTSLLTGTTTRPSESPSDLTASPQPVVPSMPVPTPPLRPAVVLPAPELTAFTPQVAGKGLPVSLSGERLTGTREVQLISTAGAKSMPAKIIAAGKSRVVIRVPDVPFANDDIIIAAISPGGVAVLIDEHTGATPWGTDGHLHDTTVIAKTGDSIDTLDRMVVLAQPYSTVSVGDDSVAFLSDHCTLTAHGKNCRIYYVAPITLGDGVTRDGLIEVPSIDVQAPGSAFRVKPAADQ